MTSRNRSQNGEPPHADHARWVRRLLRIALEGGPNVVSARTLAVMYGHLGDRDSQAEAAIRDTKRVRFAKSELDHLAALLVQEGISADDDVMETLALARWVVCVRLATAIALIYGHDPEQDWAQVAIVRIVGDTRDPVDDWIGKAEQFWHEVFESLGEKGIDVILTAVWIVLTKRIPSKFARLAVVVVLRKVLVRLGTIGPVRGIRVARDVRNCRRVGRNAQTIFRFPGLPPTTEKLPAK